MNSSANAPQVPDDDAAEIGDELETAPPRKVTNPRRVLLGVVLLIGASAGLSALYPYVGPPWIVEGPMVQQVTPTSAILVWYTSRAAHCDIILNTGGAAQRVVATADGRRQRITLENLPAGATCKYTIVEGERELGGGNIHLAKPPEASFRFIVFGDSGRGTNEQYSLAAQMPSYKPDFLVHTGDVVYPAGERGDYKARFFKPYAPLIADIAFWPTPGNHDVGEDSKGGQAYREVFELPSNGPQGMTPEASYWFDYGSARFVSFDSNQDDAITAEKIAPWVREALAAPLATGGAPRWKFVFMHHPAHTAGKYGDTPRVCKSLVPVFEEQGVDVVFSGHDHLYERTQPMHGDHAATAGERGIVYIVSGAGGAKLYEPKDKSKVPPYFALTDASTHSFTLIEVAGDELRGRQIALGDRQTDSWTVHK